MIFQLVPSLCVRKQLNKKISDKISQFIFDFSFEAVQVRPQNLHISLRVNEAYDLDFYYKQAEDYPVDLYYLMDLSKSMEDDKEKLSALGDLLAETMQNITSNFR